MNIRYSGTTIGQAGNWSKRVPTAVTEQSEPRNCELPRYLFGIFSSHPLAVAVFLAVYQSTIARQNRLIDLLWYHVNFWKASLCIFEGHFCSSALTNETKGH